MASLNRWKRTVWFVTFTRDSSMGCRSQIPEVSPARGGAKGRPQGRGGIRAGLWLEVECCGGQEERWRSRARGAWLGQQGREKWDSTRDKHCTRKEKVLQSAKTVLNDKIYLKGKCNNAMVNSGLCNSTYNWPTGSTCPSHFTETVCHVRISKSRQIESDSLHHTRLIR